MTLLQGYKSSVIWFCCYMAELQRLADAAAKGIEPSKRKVVFASSMAESYKKDVMAFKESMGFSDGFSFMEDNRFNGFRICQGRLEGDLDKVYPIVKKWAEGFPDTANNYEYEVAMYALALGWGDQMPDLYPADLETRPKKEQGPADTPVAGKAA